ncbi:PREDICTED: uncharacterized protein LOC105452902 [Wasmannia auropunctata]|uniref:uncharacterized protein LOC105452902 n=1 Tax=Wasmannia auropunctata TaxID=64793 RepID=UPI0005EF8F4C|nr:PREDICTED: uncharacterized protein LOC105452902 [Wasmannia auropunctata]
MDNESNQTNVIKIYSSLLLLAEILLLILQVVYYICEDICKLIVPPKKKSVTGEIVLITGTGHGIGKELAIGYASLGATVVCWDINEETNNQTMNAIKRMGMNSVHAYRCNIADREEVFRVAEKVKKEVGDVSILVNNAGIGIVKSLLNQSFDEVTRVINVNVIAHYWTLQAFLPSMIEKNHGHIVAISSIIGLFGFGPYGTTYCPSKSAVKTMMEAVSEELRELSNGKSSIKFTTIYPGLVLTGMLKNPKLRFPWLMGGHSPQKVASIIIDAQRRNYENTSIPSYWLPITKIVKILPDKALKCLADFLDFGADPDDLTTESSSEQIEKKFNMSHYKTIMDSKNSQTIGVKAYNTLLFLAEILLLVLKIVYYICETVYRLIVPPKKKDIAGEIVLITGAGHGIGKELAIGYALLGATVICWGKNEENTNQTMDDIKKMGIDSVYAYRCDVADREEVFRVAEKVKKEVGDVTILINNAGIGLFKPFLNQSFDEISRLTHVNIMGHYWTLQAFLPSMIDKNHGHVVAVSSIGGLFGAPYATTYCATKFAVGAIMEAVSEELRVLSNGKSSIKFTTIYPGLVHTGLVKKPKLRFPWLMGGHSPQEAASLIIDAQRRNYDYISTPLYWMPIFKIVRIIPYKALKSVFVSLDSGVYPHD